MVLTKAMLTVVVVQMSIRLSSCSSSPTGLQDNVPFVAGGPKKQESESGFDTTVENAGDTTAVKEESMWQHSKKEVYCTPKIQQYK